MLPVSFQGSRIVFPSSPPSTGSEPPRDHASPRHTVGELVCLPRAIQSERLHIGTSLAPVAFPIHIDVKLTKPQGGPMSTERPRFSAFNQERIPKIACFNKAATPLGVDFDALIAAM